VRSRKRAQARGVRFGRPRKLTPHQRQEALQLHAGETMSDVLGPMPLILRPSAGWQHPALSSRAWSACEARPRIVTPGGTGAKMGPRVPCREWVGTFPLVSGGPVRAGSHWKINSFREGQYGGLACGGLEVPEDPLRTG
jgi:hypothetical protein